jgi:hypothetical protein
MVREFQLASEQLMIRRDLFPWGRDSSRVSIGGFLPVTSSQSEQECGPLKTSGLWVVGFGSGQFVEGFIFYRGVVCDLLSFSFVFVFVVLAGRV